MNETHPATELPRLAITMTTVTFRKQGDAVAITLPEDALQRMGLEAGQDLTLIELDDGFKLVKRSPELDVQMRLARDVLRDQAEVLQELAKR